MLFILEKLKNKQFIKTKIVSYSMAPFISKDDIATIIQCNPSNINVGDIVLFKIKRTINIVVEKKNKKIKYITHRIVGRKKIKGKKYLINKGDNSIGFDSICSKQIIGKVTQIQKKDYLVDLNILKWKIVNSFFATNSIIEYKLIQLIRFAFKPLSKYNINWKLLQGIKKINNLISLICILLAKKLLRGFTK